MIFWILLLTIFNSMVAHSAAFRFERARMGYAHTKFRMGFHERQRGQVANVLFLNGYTDQMGNHKKLFRKFERQGLRVISFDYPQHGGSSGHIAAWKIKEMSTIARRVLRFAEIDRSLPLFIAGYSTGATIAVRMVQEWGVPFNLRPYGLIPISPGLPVNGTAGVFGVITESQLTRGNLRFKPRPSSTIAGGKFATSLKRESKRAAKKILPSNVPAIVFVGEERRDDFIEVDKVKDWVKRNQQRGRPVLLFECPGAKHALESEPFKIGDFVRRASGNFIGEILREDGRLRNVVRSMERHRVCQVL